MSTPTLEVLKLRLEIAQLEVRLAEQRYDYEKIILQARQIILEKGPGGDFTADWLRATDKLFQ